MKELAADESVSEEARESAKKAFEVLMSSQLLEIEQAAALKKIESEAQFANQQASIERNAEQDATMQKLEAEGMAEVKKLEAQAQLKRKKLEAEQCDMAAEQQKLRAETSDEMIEWLERHRLQAYSMNLTRIAGGCAQPPRLVTLVAA